MRQFIFILIIVSELCSCNCLKNDVGYTKKIEEIIIFKLREQGINILSQLLGEKLFEKKAINITLIYIINPNDTLLKMRLYKTIPNCNIEREVIDSFVKLFNNNAEVQLLFDHIITERRVLIRNGFTTYTSFVIDIYNRKGKKIYVNNW